MEYRLCFALCAIKIVARSSLSIVDGVSKIRRVLFGPLCSTHILTVAIISIFCYFLVHSQQEKNSFYSCVNNIFFFPSRRSSFSTIVPRIILLLSALEVMTLFECHLHLSLAFVILLLYMWALHAVSIHLLVRHRMPNSPLSFRYWNEWNDILFCIHSPCILFFVASIAHIHVSIPAQGFFLLNSFQFSFFFLDFIPRFVLFVLTTSRPLFTKFNYAIFHFESRQTHCDNTNQRISCKCWSIQPQQ